MVEMGLNDQFCERHYTGFCISPFGPFSHVAHLKASRKNKDRMNGMMNEEVKSTRKPTVQAAYKNL